MMFDTISLDQLATFEMGQSPDSKFVVESDEGIPFLQGCAEFGTITPNFAVSCIRPIKICKPGDILISVRAPVGDLNKADRGYCIGRGLAAIRFKNGIDTNFGWHLLSYWATSLRVVAQGSTFEAIGKQELANLQIADIPLPEQRRIAEILDTIDEVIQKTEALISKFKAMKQGLLYDLLTRGLDKNGKLRDPKAHPEQFKDSPLGMIPREWDTGRIDQFLNPTDGIKPGPFGSSITKIMYTPEGYKVYGQEQVISGDLTVGDYYISPDKFNELRTFEIHENDILMSLVGTVGRVLVVRSPFRPGIINPRLIRFRPVLSKGNPIFLRELLMSDIVKKQLASLFQGGTMPVLSATIVKKLILAKPKQYEQEMIAKILLAHDARIRTEEQYRDKLKLQKKGLMHDLLTGKVRVEVVQINHPAASG